MFFFTKVVYLAFYSGFLATGAALGFAIVFVCTSATFLASCTGFTAVFCAAGLACWDRIVCILVFNCGLTATLA